MGKKYLATRDEVEAVSSDVTTINTQINTPATGLDARVQATEAYGDRITQAESDIDDLELQVNDPTTGILKQLVDVDTELNEATTGVKARITDLEQGGTSTTKFRTHSPSGVYEDGEVVQRDGVLYKSGSAIDGSVTPVPFVNGTGANQWSPFSSVISNPLQLTASDSSGKLVPLGVTVAEGQTIASGTAVGTETLADDDGFIHHDTSLATGNKMRKTRISKIWDYVSGKLSGAASSYLTSNATANRVIVSNGSGKLSVSGVTAAELNILDGDTPAIATELVDGDKVVVNDDGVMKQVVMSRVSAYVNSKLPAVSATGHVTGRYMSTTSSSYQNVTSSKDGKILVDIAYLSGGTPSGRVRTSSGTTTAAYWSRLGDSAGSGTVNIGTSGQTFSSEQYSLLIWHSSKIYKVDFVIWKSGSAAHCMASIIQN